MTTMEKINEIWKERTGKDLTKEEAWKMVEFIGSVLQEAEKRIESK